MSLKQVLLGSQMKKILLLVMPLFLIGCSEYPDARLVCDGTYVDESPYGDKKLKLGVRIESMKISISGDATVQGQNMLVCSPSEINLSTKDQFYFDVESCKLDQKTTNVMRYGTYNYITKMLHFSVLNRSLNYHAIAALQCADSK